MKRKSKLTGIKKLASLLIAVMFLFTVMYSALAESAAKVTSAAKVAESNTEENNVQGQNAQEIADDLNFKYLKAIEQFIQDNYKFDTSDGKLMEGAVKKMLEENPQLLEKAMEGMFGTLDQHSVYFNDQDYKSFSTEVDGQFGGVGLTVDKRDGYVTVVSPVDNTPAQRAGIKPGDRIISVDDTDISNYETDQAVPLMRGEPGTKVHLGIKRDNVDDTLYFDLNREMIKINPIQFKTLGNNDIGYIRITNFNANTAENMDNALKEVNAAGIKKLIIDLRYNPGGSLEQVVQVAKHFVPNKGPIVSVDYKDTSKNETYYSDLDKAQYDVVVLVNEGSASASEILAGAIQDSKAGKIIGVKSYGKGTVQQLIPLKKGGAFKLTIARYLTPSGKCIDGDGIHPDIEVKNIKKKVDESTLEPMTYASKPTLGDGGKDVLAIEQRLQLLGYDMDKPDETLDEKTFEAIKKFQTDQSLFSYGVMDATTQIRLNNAMDNVEIEEDLQLDAAIKELEQK